MADMAVQTPQPPVPQKPRSNSTLSASRLGLLSDRMQHLVGEVPPTLSPLDAFAAQSRKLAKELEETRKAGQRRISRLPPHVVTESLNQHQASRPFYFRSISGGSTSSPIRLESDTVGTNPEVAVPKIRPVSEYPQLGGLPLVKKDSQKEEDIFYTPLESQSEYFDIPRAESPEALGLKPTIEPTIPEGRQKSGTSQPDLTFTLAPPNAPFAREGNHHKPHQDSDDDYASSNAGSTFSKVRKLSSSSGISLSQSPVSPFVVPHARSLSVNSTKSSTDNRVSRSHLNFSRPMSSTSLSTTNNSPSRPRPGPSHLSRPSQSSIDSPSTTGSIDESLRRSPGFVSGPTTQTSSISLPRGRMADRDSAVFLGLSAPHFEWPEPMFPGTPPLDPTRDAILPTPSPPPSTRPSQDSQLPSRSETAGFSFDFSSWDTCTSCEKPRRPTITNPPALPGTALVAPTPSLAPPSSDIITESRPLQLQIPPVPPSASTFEAKSTSSRSTSTVRPRSTSTHSNYQALSSDEHVTKAIELHQHGDLKESTYHLRIAAMKAHPTGMLLYALACRHGWGMRPNQGEGVQWLRKAMDSAMIEVADDEDPTSETASKDINEKKTHRAQFALSIYELGVSHLNGWGTEQDKPLALRCFEIAGDWGDSDALTEAGFCYANGIGCKKDLKKAAKFYRMAAAKGVNMVGNSWIYKEKYNDTAGDDDRTSSRGTSKTSSPTKQRPKSRTRSLFSRKKSHTAPN